MLVGTYIKNPGDTTAVYSPSFSRGGLAATFAIDISIFSGTQTFVVTVEHRNEDDTGFTTAGVFSNITGTGVATKDITGLKEVIRFKFNFTSGSAGDFLYAVVPAPAFRPYAD